MPNVVELWQAEEGELLLPTQVRTAEVTGRLRGAGRGEGGRLRGRGPPAARALEPLCKTNKRSGRA